MDVTSIEPIAACYSSDEEEDRKEQLLFLPVAPEIEEPEDTWGIEGLDSLETGRKSGDSKENSSPKKKRPKTYDIQLENPPINGKIYMTIQSPKTFWIKVCSYTLISNSPLLLFISYLDYYQNIKNHT